MKKFINNVIIDKNQVPFNASWLNLNGKASSIERLTGSTLIKEFKRAQEGLKYSEFVNSLQIYGYQFAEAVKEYREQKEVQSFEEFAYNYTDGSSIYDYEFAEYIEDHSFEVLSFLVYEYKGIDFREFLKFTKYGTIQAAPALLDALNAYALQLMAEAIHLEEIKSTEELQEALTVILYEFALTPEEIQKTVLSIQ